MSGKCTGTGFRVRRWDFLLLVAVLLVALGLWLALRLFSSAGTMAVVTLDGEEVARLPLGTDDQTDIHSEYGTHRVVVRNGTVSVTEAPCQDLICVHHAPVSCVGETIICLPCKLVVTVMDGDSVLFPAQGMVRHPGGMTPVCWYGSTRTGR
jgi:hypothetical protein